MKLGRKLVFWMAREQRVLIYFDDVVNALVKEYGEAMDLHLYSPREILESIGTLKRVDAVEVVHGRWEKKTADCVYYYACSECGEPVLKSQWGNDFFSDYCPNCGAKMDGDGNGN